MCKIWTTNIFRQHIYSDEKHHLFDEIHPDISSVVVKTSIFDVYRIILTFLKVKSSRIIL